MKKLILATLLGMMSIGSMNAYEWRREENNKIVVTGLNPTECKTKWISLDPPVHGAKSCLILLFNEAVIWTYYVEPLSQITEEALIYGTILPSYQNFRYDNKSERISSGDFSEVFTNNEHGIFFTYNERIKIEGIKYDEIGTYIPYGKVEDTTGPIYYLEKYKD